MSDLLLDMNSEPEDVFIVPGDLFPVQFSGLYVHMDTGDPDRRKCGKCIAGTEFLVDTELGRYAGSTVHGEVRVDADTTSCTMPQSFASRLISPSSRKLSAMRTQ